METGELGDDLQLGRLPGAPEGDVALRQLRRRYEQLRRDYENLLDRLGEIEDRLAEPPVAGPAERAALPSTPAALELAIADPLIRLRDEYTSAAARIQGIIAGLERITAGAMKGQHATTRAPVAPSAPTEESPTTAAVPVETPPAPEPQPASPNPPRDGVEEPRPRKVSVEVHGKGFGELLDFQEKLSSVPGVSRVSINAIDAERATLIVELHQGEPQGA